MPTDRTGGTERGPRGADGPPPRSRSRLDAAEAARRHAEGLPLAFDPLQGGWVPLPVEDDLSPVGPPWPEPAPAGAAAPADAAAAIRLRPWTVDDLDVFRALLDDPAVWRLLPEPYPDPLTAAQAADLIAVANVAEFHWVRAVVCDGVPVGQVRLLPDPPGGAAAPSAELSYWLGRAHWGRGLGRAAVAAAVAAAWAGRPALRRLWARVHPENRASARALERAGFLRDPAARPDGWLGYGLDRPAGS